MIQGYIQIGVLNLEVVGSSSCLSQTMDSLSTHFADTIFAFYSNDLCYLQKHIASQVHNGLMTSSQTGFVFKEENRIPSADDRMKSYGLPEDFDLSGSFH